MDKNNHSSSITQQFGPQANAYLTSTVHAQGEDLMQIAGLFADLPQTQVLDLGCGAGHVSFQVAPHVAAVTAYDLSAQMLQVVAASAAERGLDNIAVQQGRAESLPFADASFDAVVSRYSAHHWQDLDQALREVRRVLKPGGIAVFADVVSPGHPLLDTHLQAVELLRDTSHVRDYSTAEWLQKLDNAGLHHTRCTPRRLLLSFDSWVTRMRTPQPLVEALKLLQRGASAEVRDYFDIAGDGSFSVDTATMIASR